MIIRLNFQILAFLFFLWAVTVITTGFVEGGIEGNSHLLTGVIALLLAIYLYIASNSVALRYRR